MASFDFDQAEGLRRMLQGPRPRIVTFLSATPEDDKGAMLVNLGASLAQTGNEVLIVDACERDYGVARRLGLNRAATLAAVARQEVGLNQVLHAVPQGFSVASLGCPLGSNDARRLAKTFDVLVNTTASNGQLKEKWPKKVLAGDLTPGFDIVLGYKDISLAASAGAATQVALPVCDTAKNVFRMALAAGKAGQDTSCLTDYWAEANGVEKIRL